MTPSTSPAACPSITDAQWQRIKNALASPTRVKTVAKEVIREWGDFTSGVGYNGNYLACLHGVSIALVARSSQDADPLVKDRVWQLLSSTDLEHMHRPAESLQWIRQLPAFMERGDIALSWTELSSRVLSRSAHTGMPEELGQTLVLLTNDLPHNWADLLAPIAAGWTNILDTPLRQFSSEAIKAWDLATYSLLKKLLEEDTEEHITAAKNLMLTLCDRFNAPPVIQSVRHHRWCGQVTALLTGFLNTPATPTRLSLRDGLIDSVCTRSRAPGSPAGFGFVELLTAQIEHQIELRSNSQDIGLSHVGHGVLPHLTKQWLSAAPCPADLLRTLDKTAPTKAFGQSDPVLRAIRTQIWLSLSEDVRVDKLAEVMVQRQTWRTEELAALLPPSTVAALYEQLLIEELDRLPTVKAARESTIIAGALTAGTTPPAPKLRM